MSRPPRKRTGSFAGAQATSVPLAPEAVPRATYRVQMHSEFRFADATALVPYLDALGISHLYCSPYLRARPGSRHGYDIVDHATLNPEIGTRDDFDAMVAALARRGMSHLCDVVPNHMAVMGRDNAFWMDVLENGPASRYAGWFDIDWQPQDAFLAGRVLVPVLGEAYGAVLLRGELRLRFERDTGAFAVHYFEHRLPLDPRECAPIVALALEGSADRLASDAFEAAERLVAGLRRLPARDTEEAADVEARRRDVPRHKSTLAALVRDHPALGEAIDAIVERYNGSPGEPESYDALNALLDAQAFRLAHWRLASDEINYRRFFDVNDLAALRMEDDEVFDATHAFVLELAADGSIGGLRIDHPDGLADPARYFERLQERYRALVAARTGRSGDAIPGIYVAIEKISAPHEHMPAEWAVHGDTGYPFANAIVGVLVDPTARDRLDRTWRAFVGDEAHSFDDAEREGRLAIMRGPLSAGLTVLAGQALRIARADPHTRDITLNTLRGALAETVARFPVYRTYVTERGHSAQDARYIDWAVSRARGASRVADPSVFDFVRALLLAERPPTSPPSIARRYLSFAMQVQQFTAPVAAKGVEDTAFYTHVRFVALNDVGGHPGTLGLTRRAFHRATAVRAQAWPYTMLATSTHDNKRSEDVRARLAVISERVAEWRLAVRRWTRMNRSRKADLHGVVAPSRSDEYLLYQTLIGSFPPAEATGPALADYRDRIVAYMTKAAREAKVRTSWMRVDAEYEQALTAFVEALLADRADNRFLDDLRAQVRRYAWFGVLNSLTATLVKLTTPGVPDFYQGNEILDFSLVDPDNRRPVDYEARRALLASLRQLADDAGANLHATVATLLETPYDGRAKLWVAHRLLDHRRHHRDVYDHGAYVPLAASGPRSRHVLAFARRHGNHGIVAVAGRLFASLGLDAHAVPAGADVWGETALDPKIVPTGARVTDILSGTTFTSGEAPWSLARLFAHFPGAVLAW